MAKSLNKSRMWVSRIVLVLTAFIVLVSRATFEDDTVPHEVLDMVGLILVTICALGRVYATAFLGGHKNANLVDYGPFSVVRNPLYAFSLLGITGIALMSTHIVLIVLLPVIFLLLYISLIKREENHLRDVFGPAYDAYCASVPRLVPNFKKYKAPETVTMSPRLLWQAFRDAIAWVLPYVLFEIVEYAQALGWLPAITY